MVGRALRGTQATDIRPARADELAACAGIWRDSINDYVVRLGQPELPNDLASVGVLYRHLHATDPERFVVAVRPDDGAPGGERIVAFASAVLRDRWWYLSMLFVVPEEQGMGIGRALLERVLPEPADGCALGTATDSAQPISNALYSRYGIVPRMPVLHLIGSVANPGALPALPAGVSAVPFEAIADRPLDDPAEGALAPLIDDLDAEVAGMRHPQDHRYVRSTARRGFVYRRGDDAPLGYGYTSDVGRVGPVATRDGALVAPILGHLLRAAQPRGAFAVWVPGAATDAVTTLLAAGLRLDSFPVLLCWDRPLADFERYLPISPGLL